MIHRSLFSFLLLLCLAGVSHGEERRARYGAVRPPAPLGETVGFSKVSKRSPALEEQAPLSAKGFSDGFAADWQRKLGRSFSVVRHGDFVLASDLEAAQLRGRMSTTLILCRDALKRDFFVGQNHGLIPPPNWTDQPVIIFAFRNQKSYVGHLRALWNERPISPYGHYDFNRRHIVFNADTGPGTMVHEMVHALMARELPNAPIWFDEGLASLYEQCRIAGNRIQGIQNWRLPELQQALQTTSHTPLSQLLTLSDRDFLKKESLHYAEARYFCMFLESRGQLRRFYRLFRECVIADPFGQKTLERVCRKSVEALEREWIVWVLKQRYVTPHRLAAR